MGDPKRLEALLSSGQGQDGEQLIDNDMGVFQDPKNAQILPYEKKKWEVPFDTLAMLEVIGAGKVINKLYFNRIKDGNSFSREYYTSLLYPSSCNIIICDVNVNVTYMYCDVVLLHACI